MNAARRAALRGVWGVAAVVLLLGAARVARAQDYEPVTPKTWNVKLGAFFPTQGHMRSQAPAPWWALGVDWFPNLRYRPLNGDVYVGAEIAFRDSDDRGAFVLPITAKILWTITPPEAPLRVYGGLGAGAYFINTPFIGGTTQAGVKFIGGLDLNDRYFLEVNYDFVSGFSDNRGTGLRVDGVTFYGGYRF